MLPKRFLCKGGFTIHFNHLLGKGLNGEVYRATRWGLELAAKVWKRSETDDATVCKEIAAHEQFSRVTTLFCGEVIVPGMKDRHERVLFTTRAIRKCDKFFDRWQIAEKMFLLEDMKLMADTHINNWGMMANGEVKLLDTKGMYRESGALIWRWAPVERSDYIKYADAFGFGHLMQKERSLK